MKSTKKSYKTPIKSNIKSVILQKRDIAILEFIAKFGTVSDAHIMMAIDEFTSQADKITLKNYHRIMLRLVNARYIKKSKIVATEHNYITLDKNGELLLGVKGVKELVLPTLRHDMLVLDLYCTLRTQNPSATFISEYELRQCKQLHIQIADKTKIPDLIMNDIYLDKQRTIAIEMELTEKSNAILTDIILNYLYNKQIDEVWYFVKSQALGNKIHTIAGAQCNKIKVFLLTPTSASTNPIKSRLDYTEIINFTTNAITKASIDEIHNTPICKSIENPISNRQFKNTVNNSTLIGHTYIGQHPVLIDDSELNQHTLITGTTGSGKTTTILNFVDSAASRNIPVIYLDGKGSPDLINKLANIANNYNRVFKVFTLRPKNQISNLASYNPFGSGGATEWKNRIMALFSQVTGRGQEHFSLGEQHYINFVANVLAELNQTGETVDLTVLLSYLENKEQLTQKAHDLGNKAMAHKLAYLHNSKDIKQLLGDVLKLLELFVYSDYGHLFDTKGALSSNVINLKQSIANNEIVLFLFDASAYMEDTNKVAKMVINDINSSFADLAQFTKCFCIFDEFASYASHNLAETISLHRSQGMHAIIGTQSITTVKLKNHETKRVAEELIACCNTYITQTINHPVDAETLASIMGTKNAYQVTTQINSNNYVNNYKPQDKNNINNMYNLNNIFGGCTITSKSNQIRSVETFKITPQQLKDLGAGDAILYRKAAKQEPMYVKIRKVN